MGFASFSLLLVGILFTIAHFILFSKSRLILTSIVLIIFLMTFKRIKFGIYLVAFLTPLALRLPEKFGTANFSIAELILLVVLFNWILSILINRKFKFKKTKLDLPILFFFIITFISFLIALKYISFPLIFGSSADNLYPLKVLLDTFEYLLFFYVVVNCLGRSDVKKVIHISLISLLIVSLIGVYQYHTTPLFGSFYGLLGIPRITSTFNVPNFLGMFIILFIPSAFIVLRGQIYRILVSISSIAALLYSGSRGALYSLFAVFLFSFRKDKRKMLLICTLIVFLISLSLFFYRSDSILKRVVIFEDNSRIDIFKASLVTIANNPLGIGLGTFRLKRVYHDIHHTHNLYLQIALERGVLGFIIFIWLLFRFFSENIMSKIDDPVYRNIRMALMIGLTSVLLNGLVDYPFYSQRIAILFWMVMGLVVVIGGK